MQGLCDQLTGGFISFLYIYIKCNGIQGLYARLTRGFISFLYIYKYINSVVVCKASVIN